MFALKLSFTSEADVIDQHAFKYQVKWVTVDYRGDDETVSSEGEEVRDVVTHESTIGEQQAFKFQVKCVTVDYRGSETVGAEWEGVRDVVDGGATNVDKQCGYTFIGPRHVNVLYATIQTIDGSNNITIRDVRKVGDGEKSSMSNFNDVKSSAGMVAFKDAFMEHDSMGKGLSGVTDLEIIKIGNLKLAVSSFVNVLFTNIPVRVE